MADATPKIETITIPINPDLDPATREDLLRQLAPVNPALGVVGNYADIQRGGAAVVKDQGTMDSGVETPPGVTGEDLRQAKQVEDAIASATDPSSDTKTKASAKR